MCLVAPCASKGDLAQEWAHLLVQGSELSCLTGSPGQAGYHYLLPVPPVSSH